MQSAAVFVALLAAVSANSVQYATVPQLNSAVVSSQRVGGNFAYTVGQQPAYAYQGVGYPYAGYNGVYNGVYNGAYNGAYNTPVVYTTAGAATVPAVSTVGVNKVAQAYTYQAAPVSTVVAGTPAATYKTVAGVSPLAYNTVGYNGYNGLVGVNGLGYAGYPTYNGLQGYNGYTTVY